MDRTRRIIPSHHLQVRQYQYSVLTRLLIPLLYEAISCICSQVGRRYLIVLLHSLHEVTGTVNVLLFVFTRRVLPRHSIISRRFSKRQRVTVQPVSISAANSIGSFMAEKMDEEADDEKTFKIVGTPDSGEMVTAVALPPPAFSAGYRNTSDRAAFPASAAGPLMYPQSPIHTQSFRSAGVPPSPI